MFGRLLVLSLLLIPITSSADKIDLSRDYLSSKIGYDYDFNVQDFLKSKSSPLAYFKTPDGWASEIIKRACLKYNVNQRVILTRLEYEQGLITGKMEIKRNGLWIVRGNGEKVRWKKVCEIACGFGQIYWDGDYRRMKTFERMRKHYMGFSHQVFNCARFTRRKFQNNSYFPYQLFIYTPHESTVKNFYTIWKGFWPGDFE